MKKALKLITTYFLLLLCGLLFGTIIYSFYLNVLNFVAGNDIVLFSISELARAGIYVAYCMVFLICPVISYYRVRHAAGFSQTIAYVIICLFTWGLLFPGIILINKVYDKYNDSDNTRTFLSQGYFRPGDEHVYFFTKDFSENKNHMYDTVGVVIDTTDDGIVTVENVSDDYKMELKQLAYPYKEIQVKQSFFMRGNTVPITFSTLIYEGKKSFGKGIIPYISFLSLALLISVLYIFSNFFEWRLLNTTVIFVFTSVILSVNSIYFSTSFDFIRNKISSIGFFETLSKYMDNPLLVCTNLFLTIIIIVVWIVHTAIKNHKNKEI